jgi:hypothetical protein
MDLDLKHEILTIEISTKRALVEVFHKSEEEAVNLVIEADIKNTIENYPMSLHDCPRTWAVSILTCAEDYKTLEKYL